LLDTCPVTSSVWHMERTGSVNFYFHVKLTTLCSKGESKFSPVLNWSSRHNDLRGSWGM